MPSRPVSASVTSSPRVVDAPGAARGAAASDGTAAPNTRVAVTAHVRFVAAQISAVARSPIDGINTNAAPSAPRTAPSVFAAYSGAIDAPRPSSRIRAIAGSVAPIAAVAGSSHRKVPPKIHAQCASGAGESGNADTHAADSGAKPNASTSAHVPMTASQIAYPRAGRALRVT